MVPIGANETGKGNEEDEETENDERPARQVEALVVGFCRQPNAGTDYGNRAEEGEEVQDGGYVVA